MMTHRKLVLLSAFAVAIASTLLVCAHAQVTTAERPFASLTELTRDVDYIIVEIEGKEYMATVGSSCFPESDHHCNSQSLGCHFYSAANPPPSNECVYCNGTSGVDHFCCPHPEESVTCTNESAPEDCGNRVVSTCTWTPTKVCATATPTVKKCKVKPCS